MRCFFVALAIVALSACGQEVLDADTDTDASACIEPQPDPCIKAGISLSYGVGHMEDAMLYGDATGLNEAMVELVERAESFDDCL